jgi:hypothetical protein
MLNISFMLFLQMYHFARMAITGSILAAWEAGITPESTPITLDTVNPIMIFPLDRIISNEPISMKLAR